MKHLNTLGIVGTGAWGTALARATRQAGKKVLLFGRDQTVVNDINDHHRNTRYLPDIILDNTIQATTDDTRIASCDALLLVVPAQALRKTVERLACHVTNDVPLILCAKGIEAQTGKLMGDVVREFFPNNPIAVLSGPTFAVEVARGLPTALTIAAPSLDYARMLCAELASHSFRPYASNDFTGVEIAGALKNVIAIGCGIVIGKGLGENARTALMTRGLREITRLAIAMGGKQETLMGLSGLGDLVLTCGSVQSRNMSLGIALGRGERLADILKQRVSVTEGISTSLAAQELGRRYALGTPVMDAVVSVLHEGVDVNTVMEQLLSRPLTTE